ncbi:MAG TPA: hypothetical protein VMF30_08400 [Pirellulales bacterium]|nr:hypothetical protein [Pirellulales bacterium]
MAHFAYRWAYSYRIHADCIAIVAFGKWTLVHFSFANMKDVYELPWAKTMGARYLFALRFGNRLYGRNVCIERKRGFFRNILITPDEVGEFINAARAHIETARLSSHAEG